MAPIMNHRWQHIDSLELLVGGENYFPQLEKALMQASRSICLESYIFSNDGQSQKIIQLLCDAAQRGVQVRVIVDWVGGLGFAFEPQLQRCGVHFKYYNKGWFGKFGFSRTHRKIVVIDEEIAFVGGINICDDRLDADGQAIGGVRWDLALQASGKIVEIVHAAFFRQWQRLQANALSPKNIVRRLLDLETPWRSRHYLGIRHGSKPYIAFIARDNLHHRRDIERAYLKAIGQSQEEIWLVTPYFLPGYRLRQALVRAAIRGVSVNLLLGKDEFKLLDWAAPTLYGQLLKAGIVIYEYPKGLLHAKVMVVDRRWASLGSSNSDHLSFFVNHEANFVVKNHPVIKEIRYKIADRAMEYCQLVDQELYVKRSLIKKTINWLTYQVVRTSLSILAIGVIDKALPQHKD